MLTPTNEKQREETGRTSKRRRTSKDGEEQLKVKLSVAIKWNDLLCVQSELESWDNTSRDSDLARFPALLNMTASLQDRSQILSYFIARGAKVDGFHNGLTPLMVAVRNRIYENVRVLLHTKSCAQFKYQNEVKETLTKLNSRVFPEGVASVLSEMICPIGANVELRDYERNLTALEMTYNWDYDGPRELGIRDLLLSQMPDVWPDYLQKGGQPAPFRIHWGDREVAEEDY